MDLRNLLPIDFPSSSRVLQSFLENQRTLASQLINKLMPLFSSQDREKRIVMCFLDVFVLDRTSEIPIFSCGSFDYL
jgi:hypothetical protein